MSGKFFPGTIIGKELNRCAFTFFLRVRVAAFSLFACTACGAGEQIAFGDYSTDDESPIIGGTPSNRFHGVGAVESISGTTGNCTGFLIAANKVLTAAHCIYNPRSPGSPTSFNTSDFVFIQNINHDQIDDPFSVGRVETLSTHVDVLNPNWALGVDDLAVITLASSPTGPVIPLKGSSFIWWFDGRTVGYGRTNNTVDDWGYKNEAMVSLLPNRYSPTPRPPGLLYGASTVGTCKGDSGAPLLYSASNAFPITPESTYYAIGVVSYGGATNTTA
jgi:V8-like Glu-specific endopeptidase